MVAGPEGKIEAYLCREVKKLGGIPYKFTSPNRRSVPDRLCVLKSNLIYFIEVKQPAGKVSPLQASEMRRLRALGASVFVVWNKTDVDTVINIMKEDMNGG